MLTNVHSFGDSLYVSTMLLGNKTKYIRVHWACMADASLTCRINREQEAVDSGLDCV
jgi:hypothetical protein